jgi:hypothetical protein
MVPDIICQWSRKPTGRTRVRIEKRLLGYRVIAEREVIVVRGFASSYQKVPTSSSCEWERVPLWKALDRSFYSAELATTAERAG